MEDSDINLERTMITMAGKHNLEIDQGATFSQGFQWCDGNRSPINLTGYTGTCQIRSSAQDAQVLALATVNITDAVNGRFMVVLDYSKTAAIPTDTKSCYDKVQYVFDVYMQTGQSRYRVLNGYAMISPEVTKLV